MKAQDTVMSPEKLRELWYLQDGEDETRLAMAEAQAEISFETGIKEGEARMVERLSYPHWKEVQDAKQAGIKEVVDWMQESFSDFMPKHKNTSIMGERWQKWQAKLKEWGLTNDSQNHNAL